MRDIFVSVLACIVFLAVFMMLPPARAQQNSYPLPKPGQTVIYPNGGTATTLPTGTTVFSNGETAVPVGPRTYFSNGVTCMPVGNNIVCQ